MSVEAMTWAFQVPLPPCPKSLLVALANRADEEGRCWPGVADLERRTGWSRRAVQQGVRYLIQVELLCLEERYRASGKQESNLYCLRVGATPARLEGAAGARGRVQQVHGEGAAGAPESSSESSSEQSSEHTHTDSAVCGVRVRSLYSEEFEMLWEKFPRKVGKKAAWRAWQKARDRPVLYHLLAAIDLAIGSEQWQRGIIPNPATWLNQGRWADEVPVPKPVVVGPKAYQPVAPMPVSGEPCPPEVAAKLARLLGGHAFSLPTGTV